MKKAISAVLWDMDGTLIDSEPLHFQSMTQALGNLGVHTDPTLQAITTGMSESEVFRYCRQKFCLEISEAEWSYLRNSFYLDRAMTLESRFGALDIFRQLDFMGISQAIVSNSARSIVDANLRALRLHDGDLVSISRSDVTKAKPHPEPYLLAANRLGHAPDACAVIEDSLPGARSGKAAGMHVLYWPQHSHNGQHEEFPPIRDNLELQTRLADLVRCGQSLDQERQA